MVRGTGFNNLGTRFGIFTAGTLGDDGGEGLFGADTLERGRSRLDTAADDTMPGLTSLDEI